MQVYRFYLRAVLPNCHLTSITHKDVDALVNLVAQRVLSDKFYMGGNLTPEWMRNRCVPLLKRCEQGVPFTGFVVRDVNGQELGFFIMGFDDDPKKLQMAFCFTRKAIEKSIPQEVLDWALHQYIPKLASMGYRVNETELKDSTVVGVEHPDSEACQWLARAGFELRETKVISSYRVPGSTNDGRRNVYEIGVATLLQSAGTAAA
jgi:hypothetical protein